METSWLSLAPWNPKSLFSWPGKRVHGFFNTFSWDVHEKEIRSGGSTVQETDKVPWDNLYILCAVYEFDMQMPVRQSDASLFVLTVKNNTQLDPFGYSSFQCFSLTAFFQSGQPDDSWSEGSDPAQEYRMYFQFVQFLN